MFDLHHAQGQSSKRYFDHKYFYCVFPAFFHSPSLRVPQFCIAAVQSGYRMPQNGGTHKVKALLVNEKTHPPIKILTVEILPRALGMM